MGHGLLYRAAVRIAENECHAFQNSQQDMDKLQFYIRISHSLSGTKTSMKTMGYQREDTVHDPPEYRDFHFVQRS